MKRSAIVALALSGAAVIAIGTGIAVWSATRSPDPAEIAQTYFAELQDADARAALALTDIPDAGAEEAAAAYEEVESRVADARVADASEQGDSARVVVEYDIADESFETALDLTRGADGGWIITNGAGILDVSSTLGDTAAVGAVTVPVDTELMLLPGRYVVEPLPRGLVAGSSPAVITPGAQSSVALSPTVTPEATAAAQAQLDAYATACTATAPQVPTACGIRVPWAADLTSVDAIAYRIERLPAVSLASDGRSFAATDGILVATASGAARAGGDGSFTYRSEDWALRGSVEFTGNEMVLAVD